MQAEDYPIDPVMLLSVLNCHLRDYFASLDILCEEVGLDKAEVEEKLAAIDYHYNPELNQFV
ncbi:MAG: DUF4250 domain-containing protein [Lachnospiraceae bacterium]|nr:DUF4250 domain-containing protein [Lachnospiraceae bacterium]